MISSAVFSPNSASPAVIVIFDSWRSSVVLALGVMVTLGRRAGLAALGRYRQPGLVLHRERPVVGCLDGEDHRIRIFGFECQQAFVEPRYHDAGRQVGVL